MEHTVDKFEKWLIRIFRPVLQEEKIDSKELPNQEDFKSWLTILVIQNLYAISATDGMLTDIPEYFLSKLQKKILIDFFGTQHGTLLKTI